MRFKTDTVDYGTFPITLARPGGREVTLQGRAPRYGWVAAMKRLLLDPDPPAGPKLRHPNTGHVLKDENGHPIRGDDPENPEYKAECRRRTQVRLALLIWEMIRHSEGVEFDFDVPPVDDWTLETAPGYAETIYREISDSLTHRDYDTLAAYIGTEGATDAPDASISNEEIEAADPPFEPDTPPPDPESTTSGEPANDTGSTSETSGE